MTQPPPESASAVAWEVAQDVYCMGAAGTHADQRVLRGLRIVVGSD